MAVRSRSVTVRGIYVGLPKAQLEAIRTQLFAVLEQAREGKRFDQVDMGGKMGRKSLLSYDQIVQELKEVEFALKKLDPELYGPVIKRLIPNFNPILGDIASQDKSVNFLVTGIDAASGGLIKDGVFVFNDGVSPYRLHRGYYINGDKSATLEISPESTWSLYDRAGHEYDTQLIPNAVDPSLAGWGRITVV